MRPDASTHSISRCWTRAHQQGGSTTGKSHYLPGLSDAAIDVIVDNAWRFTSPYSLTLQSHMGGAIRRHSDNESAIRGRDAEFTININCGATDQELYEKDRAWVRQ